MAWTTRGLLTFGCGLIALFGGQDAHAVLPGGALAERPVRESKPAVAPLDEARRAVFWGTREDPGAKVLQGISKVREGKHFVASNEGYLNLFRKRITNLGGAYAGVGTDQAYLFIGWQRPELAWLTDYDPIVRDVHTLYHVLFAHADTPQAFLALWAKESKASTLAHLDKLKIIESRHRLLSRTYRYFRSRIYKRLKAVHEVMTNRGVPTYLTDQDTYDFVKALIAAGRVRPMVANLKGFAAFDRLATASKTLGVPLRVLYMSNAEQYWNYGNQFRKNIKSLHVDDQSVVLRTLLTWSRNEDYRYIVQPFKRFQDWMRRPWLRNVNGMISRRVDESKDVEYVEFNRTAEEAEAKRSGRPGAR